MQENNKRPLRNAHGMTLVEILIVLTIIGGLFALIGSKVSDQYNKANVKGTRILMGQVAGALNVYSTDCNKLPSTLDALVKNPGESECADWSAPYLKEKQIKDAWGNSFIYQANEGEFTLKSLGRDNREGGTGFNKDLAYEDDEGGEK